MLDHSQPPPDWRLANHQVLKQRPTAHLLDQAFGAVDEARLAVSASGQRAGAADSGTHAPAYQGRCSECEAAGMPASPRTARACPLARWPSTGKYVIVLCLCKLLQRLMRSSIQPTPSLPVGQLTSHRLEVGSEPRFASRIHGLAGGGHHGCAQEWEDSGRCRHRLGQVRKRCVVARQL